MSRLRLYIHIQKWFIRPHNTDWRYTRFSIPRIAEFVSDLEFIQAESYATTLKGNLLYVSHFVRRKLGWSDNARSDFAIDLAEFRRKKCDVVFCHADIPLETEGVPIIWHNSILDPEMLFGNGMSREEFDQLVEAKRRGFEAATVVHVATHAERSRLARTFPSMAERFVAVPFFLPNASGIPAVELEAKLTRGGPLRCLFVGHAARRKGLDRVYSAMLSLSPAAQKQIHLTVVSKQVDGEVETPALQNLKVFSGLPHNDVLRLMRESDVLIMPSRFESYGLVYIEAMSQGLVPIVPNWEVQREIVDSGSAGIITSGDPSEIAAQLEHLCDDNDFRARLALAARARYENCYSPQVVAATFREGVSQFFRRG